MRKILLMMLLAVAGGNAWADASGSAVPAVAVSAVPEVLSQADDPFGVLKYSLPYAEKGVVTAQLTVASTYYYGKSAPQNYAKAFKWFRLAAQQGDQTAQNFLGMMYLKAQGVPKDLVRAQMWNNLAAAAAAASGKASRMLTEDDLKQMNNELAKQMTPQQVAEAQKMGKDCLANKYKGCE